MTYFITALTKDSARLIKSESRTTDAAIADMVAAEYERRGLVVRRWQEG